MDAQHMADTIRSHEEDCGVKLESIEDIGMVCTQCGAVVVSNMVSVELPEEPEPEPDEAQQGSYYVTRTDADPITANLPPVDSGHILTPDEATERITDTIARLERGANFHRACIERKYAADLAFEMAWARAINRSDGSSADTRKAQATVACEGEITEKNTAEMALKATAATMHDLRAMLSGYQSVARSVGATYQGAGQAYGGKAF